MLLNLLQCTGHPSTTKNNPAPNVSSVEGEKPCSKMRAPNSSSSDGFQFWGLPKPQEQVEPGRVRRMGGRERAFWLR